MSQEEKKAQGISGGKVIKLHTEKSQSPEGDLSRASESKKGISLNPVGSHATDPFAQQSATTSSESTNPEASQPTSQAQNEGGSDSPSTEG